MLGLDSEMVCERERRGSNICNVLSLSDYSGHQPSSRAEGTFSMKQPIIYFALATTLRLNGASINNH